MTSRKELLKQIRPTLPILVDDTTSSAEQFQNLTLRPILKFQNQLILAVFRKYLQERKGVYYNLSLAQKEDYIQQAIQKDRKIKELLSGIVVGQFTIEEWYIYEKNESELRKRIGSLLIQRIQSQMGQL